ncbi:MAG: hypothetical protein DRN33_01940 [Thermoplasmata archaeon]|nr:MAG: hypothetical protein FE043_03430 [Thermoplasmata archaeon]RLF64559.1 MAG: hypothetical protein DRN33_01940 [Thermoplasmata archaeon]
MKYDIKEFPGLYIGMGDIITDGKKIGECIFNLEIIIGGVKGIEAEGAFMEFTEGAINLSEEMKEMEFRMSGVISRDHEYYVTEFGCITNVILYPKFVVKNPMEILENITEEGEE